MKESWWSYQRYLQEETEVREQPEVQRRSELYHEPDQDITILPEDPEMIAEREGMHKKLQAKIQHKDKEVEVATEEEIPPEWNAIPDLIMENQDDIMITEADTKHKRDEVA